MKTWYYQRNDFLLNHEVNKTFEEILAMSKEEFRQWVIDLRKTIVYAWDELGLPPVVGKTKQDIIDGMNEMLGYPTHEMIVKDEITGEKNVIRTDSRFGGLINGFFPNQMRTRINYTKNSEDGRSIYDYFARDDLLEKFITYASRHFKRDSFYHYSTPVKSSDKENIDKWPCVGDSGEFINYFEAKYRNKGEYDYWLAPVEEDKEYTGYNQDLKGKKYLTLTKQQIINYIVPERCKTNVDWEKSKFYQIRTYKLGQKLFPMGLKAFRVSFAQYPAQFPPLIAKFIYDTYTEEFKDKKPIIVYDTSCGWGGRILGCMSAKKDRKILYLGTDPNTDNSTENGRTKYHEVADMFNEETYRNKGLFKTKNEYKIWQLGSEVIQYDKEFQKYKGKVSLVFSSPPYGNREAYSEDETQSYKKFPEFDQWRTDFLYQTLQTAYDWLHPGGYLAWNISSVKYGKDIIPYDEWSLDICKNIGFTYIKTWKMGLMPMPGGNRTTEESSATTKYFCKVKDFSGKGKILTLKYEPLMILRK